MLILIGYQNSRTMPRSLIQKIMVEIFKCSLSSRFFFFCLLSIFIFFPFFLFLVLVFDLVFSLFVLILAVTEILNSYVNK